MLDLTIKQATEVPVWSEAIAEAGFEALDELGFTDCFHELLPVTHWMQLPAAPALAAHKQQEGE